MRTRDLVSFEECNRGAEVLVVTTAWPHADNPTYGIFVQRERDAMGALGVCSDLLFVRGYASRLAYPAAAIELARLAKRRRYRIVHAYGGEAALVASLVRSAELVVTYLGSDLLGSSTANGQVSSVWRLRRSVIRASSRLPTRTLTRSIQMEGALPETARRRNTVMPAGVDDSVFRPIGRDDARAALGWSHDERVALFASDPAVAGKRHWLAVEAVQCARSQLPDLRLHVLQGVAPDDVPLAMNAADCLLFTSAREGSPNVVKEAVMCNLPVVSTQVGDVEDTLGGVEPSWLCRDGPKELAAALVDCLRSPVRSNGRAAAGRLTARNIAERLAAVYEDAVGAPVRRAEQRV
jgi:teichuronic acid biosynthesis glycosyltransferase TuaC